VADQRDQGRVETSLVRAPFWSGGRDGFTGRCLLGTEEVAIRPRRLATRDLAVFAYLTDRYLWPPPQSDAEPAQFTLYGLGQAIYGREPAGDDRRALRHSLERLWRAEIVFGYQQDAPATSWRRLIVQIDSEMDRLAKEDFLAEGRQLGRLRGSTFAVTLAPWVAQAVRAGHFTWLNLQTLRQLGGIAARLWVYLEAETYRSSAHGLASTWIGLGRPALATLGADRYHRPRDARRALARAAARIVKVDAHYASITVEPRPGGWALVASRVLDRERWEARREIVGSLATASGRDSLDELRDS
jgi:hypothetical protein